MTFDLQHAQGTIFDTIRLLIERRSEGESEITLTTDLYEDLMLDSLEVAELSAILEDRLGSDPYSAGVVPRTVGEVIDFYAEAAR